MSPLFKTSHRPHAPIKFASMKLKLKTSLRPQVPVKLFGINWKFKMRYADLKTSLVLFPQVSTSCICDAYLMCLNVCLCS